MPVDNHIYMQRGTSVSNKNKVRIRMIDGERWYSAIDLGGEGVKPPYGSGLDTAPFQWIKRNVPADKRRVIKLSTCHKGMTYIHESFASRWLGYAKMRRATSDIRKAQSVACKARAAGVAWKEVA